MCKSFFHHIELINRKFSTYSDSKSKKHFLNLQNISPPVIRTYTPVIRISHLPGIPQLYEQLPVMQNFPVHRVFFSQICGHSISIRIFPFIQTFVGYPDFLQREVSLLAAPAITGHTPTPSFPSPFFPPRSLPSEIRDISPLLLISFPTNVQQRRRK